MHRLEDVHIFNKIIVDYLQGSGDVRPALVLILHHQGNPVTCLNKGFSIYLEKGRS